MYFPFLRPTSSWAEGYLEEVSMGGGGGGGGGGYVFLGREGGSWIIIYPIDQQVRTIALSFAFSNFSFQ